MRYRCRCCSFSDCRCRTRRHSDPAGKALIVLFAFMLIVGLGREERKPMQPPSQAAPNLPAPDRTSEPTPQAIPENPESDIPEAEPPNPELPANSLPQHATPEGCDSEQCRDAFQAFLQSPLPRAFAMGQGGSFGWSSGVAGPAIALQTAIRGCQEVHTEPCGLSVLDQ